MATAKKPRIALGAPKETDEGTTGRFEAALVALVERIAPGKIAIARSKVFPSRQAAYDFIVQTRDNTITFVVDTLAEGVEEVRAALESGEEDPIVPAWRRLSRYQREVVTRTLQELASRHMARAAEEHVASGRGAHAAYELADAFNAAVSALEVFETDRDDVFIPNDEKLT